MVGDNKLQNTLLIYSYTLCFNNAMMLARPDIPTERFETKAETEARRCVDALIIVFIICEAIYYVFLSYASITVNLDTVHRT